MSASTFPVANASAGDLFGSAIASSANGQVVIVGAPQQNGAYENDGSAQVFTWNGTDWVQRGATLSGFVPAQFGGAGAAVAISDDGTTVAFVGEGSHTAWVYRWDGTAWVARGSALANAGSGTIALSADGNTLVVADALSSASASMNGAVQVYSWSGSDWAARGAVVTTAPSPDRIQFGWSLDMADDGLSFIVGARSEGVGGGGGAGTAHVYAWNGTAWAQRGATLAATDALADEHYGQAVAMSADGKVVALTSTLDNGGKGGALVFAWSGSAWVQRGGAVLPADAQASDHFGAAVDLSADGATLILGGAWDTVGSNAGQGSARVFDWNGTAWAQRGGALTPADGAGNDLFGSAVSLSEDGLVAFVGGPYDDTNNQDVGSARSFYWNGTAWLETGPTALLSVAASSASVIEGSGGTRDVTFTVTRGGVTTSAASASWSVTGSYTSTAYAADANDFAGGVLPSGTVSFAAGETSKTITVTLNSDAAIEGDDAFTLALSNPVNAVLASSAYALGPASAQVTIIDDDTVISTRSGWFSRPEGNSGTVEFGFNIDRAGVTTGTSTVQWAVAGSGTNPANAADFAGGVLPSGSVTFAPGEVLKVVYVSVAGDTTFEPDEAFSLTLSGATGATLGTATASTIITNDDTSLSIAATSASKAEGNSGTTDFTFTVTRSGATTGASSASWGVTYSTNPIAGATDFLGGVLPSGTVSFAAGETSKTITVKVNGDTVTEPDENFLITLSSPVGATIGTASAPGVILNDDTGIFFYPYATSKAEGSSGETVFQIEVDRTGVKTGTTSVDWAIQGSGANPATGADFVGGVLPSGTITFAPGEDVKVLDIRVAADQLAELDETFILVASNPVNAELRNTLDAFTIVNDDTNLSIAATSAAKAEGNGGTTDFTFTVTRTGITTGASSAAWAVAGSGGNPANAADFAGGVLPAGTVSFAAGETSKTITVKVAADALREADEGFTVTLSGASGATLGTAAATGSILNDDTGLAISGPVSLVEGSGGTTDFTFTVTRAGITTGASSASWAVTGNGATASDFLGGVLPAGTVSFAAGETSKTITVKVVGDNAIEPDEGFTVTLSSPVGASLDTASATGTILNDDVSAFSIAATDAVLEEGTFIDPDFTFTVTRTSGAGAASVAWAVTGSGTHAADAEDFLGGALPGGTVTFADGETSKTITVSVMHDPVKEFDEGFTVTLSNPVGADMAVATATGTILDDDAYYTGSDGDDTLVGSPGTDIMTGLSGNDTYLIDETSDQILEQPGGGTDTAFVTVNYWTWSPNVEIARLTGTGALLEGNEQDNIAVANPLLASQIWAGGGNDQLWGNDFANTLLDGEAGDDILRGGHGANILRGGRGDDTFVVNHKDTVVEELPNQGTDTVWVTADGWNGVHPGGDYYEVVRLVDDARSVTLGGNGVQAVANVLGSSITITGRGNNEFYGQGGADSFTGGAGDDIFRAGTGITRMEGGLGNDQYVIKNLASTVIERAGEGYDTAWVAVEGWTVAENIEVAYLSGAAVTITGNASGVNLVANSTAASTLIAGTGLTYFWGSAFADTMRIGAGGGDVYLRGGADRVEFGAHWGSVQVSDFSQAEGDKLDFSRSGLTRADLAVTQFSDKALIEHAGEQIILYGVTALAAGDLVF